LKSGAADTFDFRIKSNVQDPKGETEMELAAAKMIGAGLACSALIGAGVGIGNIFGNYLSGAMRNPSAAPGQFTNLLIGFALAEATGLFGLLIALIILYG
jgi:F-type H+-transporting ATPase subunit c